MLLTKVAVWIRTVKVDTSDVIGGLRKDCVVPIHVQYPYLFTFRIRLLINHIITKAMAVLPLSFYRAARYVYSNNILYLHTDLTRTTL